MVSMISNQLTALMTNPAPDRPKALKVDPPPRTEQRQEVAADVPTVPLSEPRGSSPAGDPEQSSDDSVSAEELKHAVEQVNLHFQSLSRDLRFSYDEQSGHQVITVLDSKTQEVIRQIPPEEVRALAKLLKSSDGGLIETEA